MQRPIIINHAIKKFNKKIKIDGDKSLSIRFALIASQAIGKSKAFNILRSTDVVSSINILRKLGIKILLKKDCCEVFGRGINGFVYKKKLTAARKLTGQHCSVLVAQGVKDGIGITTFAIDSRFIGGSINVSSGEAITKACQGAIDSKNPLIAWSEGGGQSMFESNLSLHMMT